MYALFKTMKGENNLLFIITTLTFRKVQEQIEQQSRMVRSRRSKSSSRNDFSSSDVASQALSPEAPAVPSKSRNSLESSASTPTNRTSMEKARSKVLFRTTSNNDSKPSMSHRRSSSFLGGDKKSQTPTNDPTDALSAQGDVSIV